MTVITPNVTPKINYKKPGSHKKSASFGNAGAVAGLLASSKVAGVLEPLRQNPIAEVVVLDVGGMILPRTVIDTVKQNKQYGMETFIDESLPMVFNPFGPGIVGGAILAHKDLKGVYAGEDSAKAMGEAWKLSKGNTQDYTKTVLSNLTAHYGQGQNGNLTGKALDDLAKKSAKLLDTPVEPKAHKKAMVEMAEAFTQATGGSDNVNLNVNGKKVEGTNINRILHDMHTLGEQMAKRTKENGLKAVDGFINEIADLSKKKTVWGTAISIAGMAAIPYLNKKFTKLRTGKEGYVAYKDFENDTAPKLQKTEEQKAKDKKNLILFKTLSATGMAALMVSSLGGLKTFKPKNLLKAIELKDKMPGMNMIKLMYGSFLVSRIATSRDATEVKNRTIRDYWGFTNWLMLGPVVAKGIMNTFDKTLLNKPKDSGFLKWGIPSFSEIRAKSAKMLADGAGETAVKRLKAVHTGGIIGGLIYSVAALGIGIPILNNWLTNSERKKELEAIALQQNHSSDKKQKAFVSFLSNNKPALLNSEKNSTFTGNLNPFEHKKLEA